MLPLNWCTTQKGDFCCINHNSNRFFAALNQNRCLQRLLWSSPFSLSPRGGRVEGGGVMGLTPFCTRLLVHAISSNQDPIVVFVGAANMRHMDGQSVVVHLSNWTTIGSRDVLVISK